MNILENNKFVFMFLLILTFSAKNVFAAAPIPYVKARGLIAQIESQGNYAVVNLRRAVPNTQGCAGPFNDTPAEIRTFYIDVSTTTGKLNYTLILTIAAARRRIELDVSGCETSGSLDLPIITGVHGGF